MEWTVSYCTVRERLITSKFIHRTDKNINLLGLVPSQFSLGELRKVLRPKLGDRYQVVERGVLQLNLLVNLKLGAVLLAAPERPFVLPAVVILQATSFTFANYLLTKPVDAMSKFLKGNPGPEEICERIYCAHKNATVLRLRVTSNQINFIRKLWPFLWTSWEKIVLFTHQRERDFYYPPIRTVNVPFCMEISRLEEKCRFPEHTDTFLSALQTMACTVNLLLQGALPIRKLSLKKLVKAVKADAKGTSCMALLSRVCGLAKLQDLRKALQKEVGFVVNFVHRKISLGEYIDLRRTSSFTNDEASMTLPTNDVIIVWSRLTQLETLGLLTLSKRKHSQKPEVVMITPKLPKCLCEIMQAFFASGEMACMKTFQEYALADSTREEIVTYLSHVFKTQKKTGRWRLPNVQVDRFHQSNTELHIPPEAPEDPNETTIISDSCFDKTLYCNPVAVLGVDINSEQVLSRHENNRVSESHFLQNLAAVTETSNPVSSQTHKHANSQPKAETQEQIGTGSASGTASTSFSPENQAKPEPLIQQVGNCKADSSGVCPFLTDNQLYEALAAKYRKTRAPIVHQHDSGFQRLEANLEIPNVRHLNENQAERVAMKEDQLDSTIIVQNVDYESSNVKEDKREKPERSADKYYFQCTFCSKRFAKKNSLVKHSKTHTVGNPSNFFVAPYKMLRICCICLKNVV